MINSLLIFILGLIMGSFINVVIYRVPLGKSVIRPGSYCPVCGHTIKVWDLVPVVSYIVMKGKCRCCKEKISMRYPLTELFTALAFLSVYLNTGSPARIAAGFSLSVLVIASAYIDLEHGIIPDKLTQLGIIAGLLLSPFTVTSVSSITGAIFFGGILWGAGVLSGGGMGGGDIKLALATGALCGMPDAILAFIISAVGGGIWGIFLLITRQVQRKGTIKFGPFLAIGSYLAYVYGSQIIQAYFRILGME